MKRAAAREGAKAGTGPTEVELQLCQVEELRSLTATLFLLELRAPRPVAARPGQFAMLRANDGGLHPLLPRPMSLLSGGERPSFLLRRVGLGTERLTTLRAGDVVRMLAPIGRGWPPPPASGELVLVAGGVGLAPLLFAAQAQVAGGGRAPTILYGARTASELVLIERLEAVGRLDLATDDGTRGQGGLVTELLARRLDEVEVGAVWTCGPEPMMVAVAQIASSRGVSCLVSVEARMACGRGLCLGCARPDVDGSPRYVCREGPVFEASDLYG